MLKLFFVTMNNGKPLRENGAIIYFELKPLAKIYRDSVQQGAVVSRGPDNQKSPRGYPAPMRLQPKHTRKFAAS